MKRKNRVDQNRKEKKQNKEKDVSLQSVQTSIETPELAMAEEVGADWSFPFAIDPLSFIAAARNSIMRFITGASFMERNSGSLSLPVLPAREEEYEVRVRTEVESGEENPNAVQSAAAEGETEDQMANLIEMRNAIRTMQDLNPTLFDTFRAITSELQQRDLDNPEEGFTVAEIEMFFENSLQNRPEQSPLTPNANAILTIIYYTEDNTVGLKKTLCKEDIENGAPTAPANGKEGECPICLIDIKNNEIIRKLQCMHIFHSECVYEWLNKYSNECPMCRKEAVSKTVENENPSK